MIFTTFSDDFRLMADAICKNKNSYVQRVSGHEFSVAHYTGKLTYDARDMADKNRDFVPPEMVFGRKFLNIWLNIHKQQLSSRWKR